MTRRTRTAAVATAVAAVLALPGVASAETAPYSVTTFSGPCTENRDTSGSQYDVRLCGVTDIDQQRTGLIADGTTHCGPASLYNSIMYLATEVGVPIDFGGNVKPGQIDPKDPANYTKVTTLLGWLGWKSKLDGGTNFTDLRAAFDDVTASAEAKGWSISSGVVDNLKTPDFGAAIAQRLKAAPVQIAYGRYITRETGELERDGGHIVTVVAAKGNFGGDTIELTLADPGRQPDLLVGNYLDTQSSYVYQKVTLKKVTFRENTGNSYNTEMGGGGGDTIRTVTRWEAVTAPYTAPTTRQMVEGFNWFEAKKA